MVLGCSGFLRTVVPIPHKILTQGDDRLMCSGVWVDSEYCVSSSIYDFVVAVVLSLCTQEGVKTAFSMGSS